MTQHCLTLGEGGTPLIDVSAHFSSRIGGARVLVKAEHLNPTGSFKDRIAAVAASIIHERGLRGAVGTSSGNGGAAIATYGAAFGFPVVLLTLPDAPREKLAQIIAAGATMVPVDGLGVDSASTDLVANAVSDRAAQAGWLPFLTGARFAPEIMAGAAAISAELAEQCPEATAVYAPVGGGGLVSSLGRGYDAVEGRAPRLVAVQPTGSPTVRAALAGRSTIGSSTTSISGLQVAVLFDDVLPWIDGERGLVEVDDESVAGIQRDLARAGVYVERAGAIALAGAIADAEQFDESDTVIVIATGAGWKQPSDFMTDHRALDAPVDGNSPSTSSRRPLRPADVASELDLLLKGTLQ